jgi:hypothetical protein
MAVQKFWLTGLPPSVFTLFSHDAIGALSVITKDRANAQTDFPFHRSAEEATNRVRLPSRCLPQFLQRPEATVNRTFYWCNPPNCTPIPSGSLTWKLVLALPVYSNLRRFSSASNPSFSASQLVMV